MESKRTINWELWISAFIVLLTAFLMFAYYNRWFSFAARIGPFRIIHYVAFTGALFIALGVILFVAFKRRSPSKYKAIVRVHAFGNLLSFLLISLHFAGQVGRPADFYPAFGTGLTLYIGMVLLVATGLTFRFRPFQKLSPATNRLFHVGLAFSFYIIILVHILHGLGIL